MHYIPSSSLPSSNLLFPESRKQNPRCSPHLHRRQRRSTAGLHVPWHLISTVSTPRPSKKSSFCRHRVIDPFFDPSSNLTFTLLVNGFLPKDRTVPSSLTDFSLFFFFFFTNWENPHFFCSLFAVATIFDLQSKHIRPTFSKYVPDQPLRTM